MAGIDFLFMERLVIGGILATLAVGVAFGPELHRAVVRLRRRQPTESAGSDLETTTS